MSAWLSYSLADFMMFSKETYFRLFELHNRALWPAQLAVLASAIAAVALAAPGRPWRGRTIAATFAGLWLLCAWAYHLESYARIHLAAPLFAAGFALQALLLLWLGVARGRLAISAGRGWAAATGRFGIVAAFFGYPLLAPLSGRPWLQAEIVGLAPDPTVAATFALMLLAARPPWLLLAIPCAWAAVSAATLWTLGAREQALVLPVVAVATVAAVGWRRWVRSELVLENHAAEELGRRRLVVQAGGLVRPAERPRHAGACAEDPAVVDVVGKP
jgi:hypothetical protein